jgi:hypothetical protein
MFKYDNYITNSLIITKYINKTYQHKNKCLRTLVSTLLFLPIVCRVQRLLWNLSYRDDNYRSISFDADVYRHCFGLSTNKLVYENDFEKLPLASGWCYHINKRGTGVQLSFPVRLKHLLLIW